MKHTEYTNIIKEFDRIYSAIHTLQSNLRKIHTLVVMQPHPGVAHDKETKKFEELPK